MLEHPEHNHDHGPGHSHDIGDVPRKRLWWALVINLVFLVVEVVGGVLFNSLALLADAGHMVTDVAALALALFVSCLSRRAATPERTFGLLRAEVLGAFVNGATLVLIVGLIFREAWLRLGTVQEINGPAMLAVAVMGLGANVGSALVLFGSRKDNLNVEGAFLHMVADGLGSIGVIIAGAVIWTFGWTPIDPIASVVIGLFILYGSVSLLKRTINILLEATPENVDYNEVKQALEDMDHIESVGDLHIWTITSGKPVLSAHIKLSASCCDTNHWQQCLKEAQERIRHSFGIEHSTLQIEPAGESCPGECEMKDGKGSAC